ncbi:tripartite motif-containing protein 45-like [Lytechinus variegatus]|uniref:tripartite motif-containing protein 45-like n=1 Tax=Lytechinus variegatus TaxID=7654 RepID=UPI001BB18BBB|nr:tripartite motif-containing protein 45-like [Lytechinus variegatus]
MAEELKDTIAQSLECPVCLTTFTDPKILSCSHTYCKVCLEKLLECHGDDQMIRCPVCKADTQVPHQDVDKLPASQALRNLIEDVKNQHQICTNCDSENKPKAVVYCQDCGNYLCLTCHNMHSQWKNFVDHEIIAMSEISSGKVSIRRYRKCRKHPKEDEECFCSNCKRFTCFRCAVMEHKDQGHQVIESAAYESHHTKTIDELKSKVEKKQSSFQNYIDLIDKEQKCVDDAMKHCADDIVKAYDEAVQQLTEKREILLGEVKGKTERVEEALGEMKKSAQQRINQLTTIAEMVINRKNAPVDMDTRVVYDTLCEDLQEALNQENADKQQPNKTCMKAKSSSFERNSGKDELGLGKIVNVVVKSIALPTKDSMNAMINTPDCSMAVGCVKAHGVNIFSADGRLQQTVLKDVQIFALGFLSDGRCVAMDNSNTLALYTPEFMKLDVMFETLNCDEGGISNLTVDSDDLIYVSYRKPEKIQVFSSAGGKAVKEIQCHGYVPSQITSYNDSLIISTGETVHLIDKEGDVKHTLTKGSNTCLYAAVSQSNTILIAMVKYDEGLVIIEEYTDELKYVRNLVKEYKIEKPERLWYYLKQYHSGEIAFCTPDNLYIIIRGSRGRGRFEGSGHPLSAEQKEGKSGGKRREKREDKKNGKHKRMKTGE